MSGETYGNRYWISQLQNFLLSWQPILSLFSIFLNLLIHLSKHQEWEALYSPPLYLVSLKSMSVQGATKGAIYQLTKTLACERAKDNIRSNAVAPRYIRTSMVEQVTPDCYVTINHVQHHVGKGRCLNFSMEVIPHTPTAIH